MTESTMRQIVAAAEADGLDVAAHEGYSGRGMHGEETWAVTATGFPSLLVAVAQAVRASDDPDAIIAEMWGVRTDKLGRDIVLY